MDDQVPVRVCTAAQTSRKARSRSADGELRAAQYSSIGCALDVLHDEVGAAVVGGAAVEEPGDVGVVEAGEDLPLVAEAARGSKSVSMPRGRA